MQKCSFESNEKDMKVITVLLFPSKKINYFRTQNKVLLHCFNDIQFTYVLQTLIIYIKNLNIGLEKIIFCLHLNFNKFLPYKPLKMWFILKIIQNLHFLVLFF